MHISRFLAALISLSLAASEPAHSAEFHIATSGIPDGDGSRERPWDLVTALGHPRAVKPGDTLWLHGGTYRGNFASALTGTAGAPILVRQAPGERATIALETDAKFHCALTLKGAFTRYHGFEVTNENPRRRTERQGSWPEDLQRGSVDIRGHHIQLVNLIIHDLGTGVGFWSEGEGGELYGCLIYNNGWSGPDRGHGHAVYSQNELGKKRIVDCMFFQQFGHGLQVYGSGKATLKGYHIAGNIAFNNGILHKPGSFSRNLHVGGEAPLEDVIVEGNMTWNSALQLGYPWGPLNRNVIVRDNYLHGQTSIYFPGPTLFKGNTFVCDDTPLMIQLGAGNAEGLSFSRNAYFQCNSRKALAMILAASANQGMSWESWNVKGYDDQGTLHPGFPGESRVFVRPNQYEPGRAHFAVYNWAGLKQVPIDLCQLLKPGQSFKLHNARDPLGPALLSGTYDGAPVHLPMLPRAGAQPAGMPDHLLLSPEPAFGAYVVFPDGHGATVLK